MNLRTSILIAMMQAAVVIGSPTVVSIQKGGLDRPYPIVGTLLPIHETKIGTQVNGRVKTINAEMGDRVKKGQVLVELDSVFVEIELNRQTALHDLAKAGYDESLADYNRLKPLWEKNPPSISKKSFEDAEIRCRQRKAQLDQAQADLDNTNQRLRETKILAPFDGVVVKRNVDFGEAVTTMPAITVAEIADDSKLLLEFFLPQDLLEKVKCNRAKVSLEIPTLNKKIDGVICKISPQLEKDTRTFLCQVQIDNPDGSIHAGSFVKGTVYWQEPNHYHAQKEAFVEQDAKWFAKVMNDGKVILKPVVVAFTSDHELEVADGLEETDQLVLE